jgi:hypothetical protein
MNEGVIKTIKSSDFGLENSTTELKEVKGARGIIINRSDNIALLKKDTEYKLPGLTVDENVKDISDRFVKNAFKELDADIEVVKDLGVLIEENGVDGIRVTNNVFICSVISNSKLNRVENDGYEVIWVSPEEALQLLSSYKNGVMATDDVGDKFCSTRDEFILRYYLINFKY